MPTAPAVHNLTDFAKALKFGDTRLLIIADSIWTLETAVARMIQGIRDTWRPTTWKGFSGQSACNFLNYGSVGLEQMFGPEGRDSTYTRTNRWDMVSGVRAQTWSGALPDTAVTQNTGLVATNFSPNAYRELVFKGPANGDAAGAGNAPNGTPIFSFHHNQTVWMRWNADSQPSETASIGGNWTVRNTVLKARLIYFRNPNGPTLSYQGQRAGGLGSGTSQVVNFSGSESVQWVDVDVGAASVLDANSRVRPTLFSSGVNDETDKVLPIIGCRIWDPSVRGLELAVWANGGWNSSHFTNQTLCADTHLARWLEAHDWPTHIMMQVGQNQTAGETTELNAGTFTAYKANIAAIIDRLNGLYAAAGLGAPKWCLNCPFDSSRSAANYDAMGVALHQLSKERGSAFINMNALSPAPRAIDSTDAATVWTTDNVHPSLVGGQGFAAIIWAAIETAILQAGGSRWRRGRSR